MCVITIYPLELLQLYVHVVLHPQKTENETFSPSLLRELKTRKPWLIRPELPNFAFKQENLFASQLRCSSNKRSRPNHHVPRTSFLTLPYLCDSHFNLQQIPLLWTANNFRGLFFARALPSQTVSPQDPLTVNPSSVSLYFGPLQRTPDHGALTFRGLFSPAL